MSKAFGISVALIVAAAVLTRPRFWTLRAVRQAPGDTSGVLYRLVFGLTVGLGLFALAMAAWIAIYAD